MAELHSKILTPTLPIPIFFTFMQILVKIGQRIGWRPSFWVWRPLGNTGSATVEEQGRPSFRHIDSWRRSWISDPIMTLVLHLSKQLRVSSPITEVPLL